MLLGAMVTLYRLQSGMLSGRVVPSATMCRVINASRLVLGTSICADMSLKAGYLLGDVLDDILGGVAPDNNSLQGLQLGQRLEQELDLVFVDETDTCL